MTPRRFLAFLAAAGSVLLLLLAADAFGRWQVALVAVAAVGPLLPLSGLWVLNRRQERRAERAAEDAAWAELRGHLDRAAPWDRDPDPMLDADDAALLWAELAAIDEGDRS